MKRILLLILTLIQIQFSFGQDYMNNEKSLLISRLKSVGFDTIQGSTEHFSDSSDYIIARFNENYCSYIEYHLASDGEIEYCDSIYFTSGCVECFDVTLNEFIKSKQKKWKKDSETVFYSLKNKGKSIYGPPREIKYMIQKMEVVKATNSTNPKFYIHFFWVTENEYKRIKKIKTYR